jgi:hypothetical protein
MRFAANEKPNHRHCNALRDKKMSVDQARQIVGNRAHWELLAMRKALSMHAWLNTPEESLRLAAVKTLLKAKK